MCTPKLPTTQLDRSQVVVAALKRRDKMALRVHRFLEETVLVVALHLYKVLAAVLVLAQMVLLQPRVKVVPVVQVLLRRFQVLQLHTAVVAAVELGVLLRVIAALVVTVAADLEVLLVERAQMEPGIQAVVVAV
jgi:hypothetical protein